MGDSPAPNIALDSKENTSTSHPMELEVVLEGGPAGPPGPTGAQGPDNHLEGSSSERYSGVVDTR
jgi:hypothetical protein